VSVDTPTTAQARARLRSVLGWRSRPATAITTVLFVLLGFVAAVQFATPDDVLDRASRADLVQILDGLGTRADQLEDEIARLEQARSDLLAGAGDSEAALAEAEARLQTLGILAGTLPAAGPGVAISVSDPDRQVDASSMLSTVQELRDAGAEALQIDGTPDRQVRVVASTAFTDSATGGVLVGGVNLLPPYTITALGDPATLATALGIPGGAVATIESRGAAVSIRESAELLVDALHEPGQPSYARPALPEEQDAG
jgi:uncharacterized protein YlxW (UPF0749 family)